MVFAGDSVSSKERSSTTSKVSGAWRHIDVELFGGAGAVISCLCLPPTHTQMHHISPFLLTERREEITLPDELIRQVSDLDNIFKDVVASREAVIDSEGFRILSAIGREQVDSVQGELIQFDTIVYAEKLVTYMGGRRADVDNPREAQLDWRKLGRRAMRACRRAPTPSFL